MKTKIIMISLGTMLSAMIVTIIVLASLQSNGGMIHANPTIINIYKSSIDASASYSESDTKYAKIVEMYKDMTERSMLEQIAGGSFANDIPIENTEALAWTEYNKTAGVYIEFIFEKVQKITVSRAGSTRRLNISGIIFRVNNDNSYSMLNIYYKTAENYATTDSDGETVYPIMVNANTSKLYKYLVG